MKSRLRGIATVIRRRRKLLYASGITMLVLGLLLGLIAAVSDLSILAIPGIILPIVGSILLLLNYSAAVGRPGEMKHEDALDEAGFGVFVYLYLGLCVAVMLIYTPQVLEELSRRRYGYVITPWLLPTVEVDGIQLTLFFLFIVAVILLSYNALTKHGFVMYLKVLKGQPVPKECSDTDSLFGNPISTISWAFITIVFLSNAFYLALLVGGHEPNIPDFGEEIWLQVGSFTTASVWEEIESRVLLIGIPILCVDFLFRRERVASPVKYITGGNMEIGIPESGAALFSSLVFGLAHVELWDFWKFFPTTITGLFLAYLFMRFGLYAAVILHFMLNFFDMPFVVLDSSSEFGLPIIFLVFGLWGFVKYGRTLVGFVYHDLMEVPRPPPPPEPVKPRPVVLPEPQMTEEEARIYFAGIGRGSAYFGTSLIVILSVVIMVWMSLEVAISPEYEGLESTDEWIGFLTVMGLSLSALIVLVIAWVRADARTYLIAATLSAFSFTGPLALLAEFIIWRAYRKHDLPWKKGDEHPTIGESR